MSSPQPVTGWQRTLIVRLDIAIYQFSRHWLATVNTILALYVGLPVLAPIFMYLGFTAPAQLIYAAYRPMCHQMATRSFFLFGEQYAYPRDITETALRPLESYAPDLPEYAGLDPADWAKYYLLAGRAFLGNARMGYKMALCERDMGIYSFMLFGGLLYGLLRQRIRIRPLPFLIFLLVGLGPIALDGFSQLFGYYGSPLPGIDPASATAQVQQSIASIFPLRESTPFLRTFTGALFGLMLAWLLFPQIEPGMQSQANFLEEKLRRAGELPGPK